MTLPFSTPRDAPGGYSITHRDVDFMEIFEQKKSMITLRNFPDWI